MQVTNDNAIALLPEFRRALAECDFVTMDQEMTGITVMGKDTDRFGPPRDAFDGAGDAARKYNAFQVGICLAKVVPTAAAAAAGASQAAAATGLTSGTTLELRPYNFWLRQHGRIGKDVVLSMSAIDFLTQHSMDFNTWLRSGMEYCSARRAKDYRGKYAPEGPLVSNEADKAFVKATVAQVTDWATPAAGAGSPIAVGDRLFVAKDAGRNTGLEVGVAMQRRLQNANVDVSVKTHLARFEFEMMPAGWARAELAARAAELQNLLGFRLFFEALLDSGKPFIGHQFSSDLWFFLNQHDATLAESYADAKRRVHTLFPRVYDTKALGAYFFPAGVSVPSLGDFFNQCQSGETVVTPVTSAAAGAVQAAPRATTLPRIRMVLPAEFASYAAASGAEVLPAVGAASCSTDDALAGGDPLAVAHQGGYDALMTAVVFQSMVACGGDFPARATANSLGVEIAAAHCNEIGVFGTNYFMKLGAEDDVLAGCQVLQVEHPSVVVKNTNEIVDLLRIKFEEKASSVLDDSEAAASSPLDESYNATISSPATAAAAVASSPLPPELAGAVKPWIGADSATLSCEQPVVSPVAASPASSPGGAFPTAAVYDVFAALGPGARAQFNRPGRVFAIVVRPPVAPELLDAAGAELRSVGFTVAVVPPTAPSAIKKAGHKDASKK
jgi:hypothetical protein